MGPAARLPGRGRPAAAPTQNTGNGTELMREYVWLECTVCSSRNYRTQKETRGADRLELKKYCRHCKERKHTPHKESRKK